MHGWAIAPMGYSCFSGNGALVAVYGSLVKLQRFTLIDRGKSAQLRDQPFKQTDETPGPVP